MPFSLFSIREEIPPILRAREFRLYAAGGRRFVDLWQSGGRALLGHTPSSVLREMKNAAERGLFAPFPHPQEGRFFKALSCLFPNRVFRVYKDEWNLRLALESAGFPPEKEKTVFFDPFFAFPPQKTGEEKKIALWRPFLDLDYAQFSLFAPILPFSPPVLAVNDKNIAEKLPASDLIPPVTLAAATRCVYDLIASPERGAVDFPKIRTALKTGAWIAKGVYVRPSSLLSDEAYSALFRVFLDVGFLLPPDQTQPAILPATLSAGEESKLAKLFLYYDKK
jgi:hypothetical protein